MQKLHYIWSVYAIEHVHVLACLSVISLSVSLGVYLSSCLIFVFFLLDCLSSDSSLCLPFLFASLLLNLRVCLFSILVILTGCRFVSYFLRSSSAHVLVVSAVTFLSCLHDCLSSNCLCLFSLFYCFPPCLLVCLSVSLSCLLACLHACLLDCLSLSCLLGCLFAYLIVCMSSHAVCLSARFLDCFFVSLLPSFPLLCSSALLPVFWLPLWPSFWLLVCLVSLFVRSCSCLLACLSFCPSIWSYTPLFDNCLSPDCVSWYSLLAYLSACLIVWYSVCMLVFLTACLSVVVPSWCPYARLLVCSARWIISSLVGQCRPDVILIPYSGGLVGAVPSGDAVPEIGLLPYGQLLVSGTESRKRTPQEKVVCW